MMMQPSINIVLTADEETVRLICATISFLMMCWCALKLVYLLKGKPDEIH